MKFFICAAGTGSRISTLTKGIPKSLLTINGHSILEYLLKIIVQYKYTKEINIIIGYKYKQFIDTFGYFYEGIPIKYHINPIYDQTNNLYSLFCAKDQMNCNNIIFMTADLIIAPELVYHFLSEKTGNKILIDKNKTLMKNDVVKVVVKDNKVSKISKDIASNIADGSAVGLYRLNQQGKNIFFNRAKKLFEDNYNHGFIEPIPYMLDSFPFETSIHNSYMWFDVDTPEDFQKAKQIVPELYKNLKN